MWEISTRTRHTSVSDDKSWESNMDVKVTLIMLSHKTPYDTDTTFVKEGSECNKNWLNQSM